MLTGTSQESDAVEVRDERGDLVAKGLVRCRGEEWRDADDLVMHRDDLVVLRTL